MEDVQRELLELVAAETILIGHSLENDLKRLRMIHASCVDTVALYPQQARPAVSNQALGADGETSRAQDSGGHARFRRRRARDDGTGAAEDGARTGVRRAGRRGRIRSSPPSPPRGRRCSRRRSRLPALRRFAAVGASSTAAAINDAEAETMLISEVRKPTGGGMLFKTDADAEPAEPAEPARRPEARISCSGTCAGTRPGRFEQTMGDSHGRASGGGDWGCRVGCRNDESARLGGGGRVRDDVEESVAADAALMDVDAVVGSGEAMPPGVCSWSPREWGLAAVADAPGTRNGNERRASDRGGSGRTRLRSRSGRRSAGSRALLRMVYGQGVK